MYDIRQFKPTLYLLVMLGITGFAVAAEEPGLWILATTLVGLSIWLMRRGKFTPMPRWAANTITLLAFAYVAQQVIRVTGTPILLIGQFLVLLQIVKLYEKAANRDYAQLIVLSLLLMVAAAISTSSLLFACIFFPHLLLSLYCCLLFHLKVETDKARKAQTLPEEKLSAVTLRQDQRYLGRSMRRLTGMVSTVALLSAVLVFLFFPRGTGAGMFGQFQLHPPETLTGFSDEVQLNQVARITENNTPVATVRVTRGGVLVTTGALRLRAATFDHYEQGKNGGWQWLRPISNPAEPSLEAAGTFSRTLVPATGEPWRQTIRLEPIGSKALFALPGIRSITPQRDIKLVYHYCDGTIQRTENLNSPLEYDVVSNNALGRPVPGTMVKSQSVISQEIIDFAHDPEVSGAVAANRPPQAAVSPLDEQIAGNIERYFKTHFGYTLDLTDVSDKFAGNDPLGVFVKEVRRGHCEYFAGAMTLACQSLGFEARMVTGFNTDEYNRYGEYFQVRQSHAHAWVEVLTTEHGWVTFDPTAGRDAPPNEARSAWQRVKHVFDWLEFKWANSVVAYDGANRENLIQRMDNRLVNTALRSQVRMNRFKRRWNNWIDGAEFWTFSSKMIGGVMAAMSLVIVAAVIWYLLEQRRIRRRAARIGLDSLPVPEQIRLVRQLGFYEEMMDVLRRNRIARPRHLTPHEFSRTLSFLPTEAYAAVERLTRIFYRVRYGGAQVQPSQQRRLAAVVDRLSDSLAPLPAPPSEMFHDTHM